MVEKTKKAENSVNTSSDSNATKKLIFKVKKKDSDGNLDRRYYRECIISKCIDYKAVLIESVKMGFITKEEAERFLVTSFDEVKGIAVEKTKAKLKDYDNFFTPSNTTDVIDSDFEDFING